MDAHLADSTFRGQALATILRLFRHVDRKKGLYKEEGSLVEKNQTPVLPTAGTYNLLLFLIHFLLYNTSFISILLIFGVSKLCTQWIARYVCIHFDLMRY